MRLKQNLRQLIETSQTVLAKVPPRNIGCLYVDRSGIVLSELTRVNDSRFSPHKGTVRGSWPRIVASS
ncbi:hypothetical protein EBZ80_15325 [bacterium]|nr:hypothetical protein [bacterium]